MRVPAIFRRAEIGFLLIALLVLSQSAGQARARARIEPKIPDIPGYLTLRCDFHMHTVFSDGRVWPTVRTDEAWREGLDAFSITDHIEHQSFENDVKRNLNRSHELALPGALELGLLLIKGGEITKKVPPGHFNALFLKDCEPLDKENYLESIGEAVKQGAFVFWNHPPFMQKDNRSIWHPEHTVLYEKGWLHGIEVVNGGNYYPEAHQWCIEKKLTMMGSSDSHNPINLDYDPDHGDRRPMTLVFATARTEEAVREALFARRTAVYARDSLYGDPSFLGPIFIKSVEVVNPRITVRGRGGATVRVRNLSDIPFHLAADSGLEDLGFPARITLLPGATVQLRITGKSNQISGERQLSLPYRALNLRVSPSEGLPVTVPLTVSFVPEPEKK